MCLDVPDAEHVWEPCKERLRTEKATSRRDSKLDRLVIQASTVVEWIVKIIQA